MARIRLRMFTREVRADINRHEREVLENIGDFLESEQKLRCPVSQGFINSGALRDSLSHYIDGNKLVNGTPLEYGVYQEKGTGVYAVDGDGRTTPWRYKDRNGVWHKTVGNRPQPFLKPSYTDNLQQIESIAIATMRGLDR